MKIQEPEPLKKWSGISLLVSVFLVMSLLVAGCVQDTTGNSGQSAAVSSPADASGNSAPVQMPATIASADAARQGTNPYGGNSTRLHNGGNFLTNETRIAAASQALGVSESDLKNALTPTAQGRVNFTTAAAQLGVTPDQLSAALGIPSGVLRNSTSQRGARNTTEGQAPGS